MEQPERRLFLRKLRSPVPDDDPDDDLACAEEETLLASRENILASMQGFLTRARAGDVVLIHYSGHGSYEYRPKELWHLDGENNPTHRGETLICCDTYATKNGQMISPLRDLEIRWMIAQIAQQNPHILVITDCCNSSGSTRVFDPKIQVRQTKPKEESTRVIQDFAFFQTAKSLLSDQAKDFRIPEGRHVALHACHSYELAKETNFPEGRHGVLTYYMLQTLRATKGQISYRDLIKIIRAKAMGEVTNQTPQIYAPITTDAELTFLGGAVAKNEAYYSVRVAPNQQSAILDAGTLHGLPPASAGKTWVALYPHNIRIADADPQQAIRGFLRSVGAQESEIALAEGEQFPADAALLKAVITATPIAKTKVVITAEAVEPNREAANGQTPSHLQPLAEGVELLQQAMQGNPFIEAVAAEENFQYRIFAYHYAGAEKYRIAEKDTIEALVQPRVGFTAAIAEAVVEDMAHIARWESTLRLTNPHNHLLQAGDVELVATDSQGHPLAQQGGQLILHQEKDPVRHTWSVPRIKLKVVMHNRAQVALYCALLHLTRDYGVNPDFLAPDAQLGKRSYVDDGKNINWEKWEIYAASHIKIKGRLSEKGLPIGFKVPDDLLAKGIHEVTDHFKLIVSTEQFDARHLYQSPLHKPDRVRDQETPAVKSPLDALMRQVRTRTADETVPPPQENGPMADWWTSLLTIKTRRGDKI